MFVFWFLFFFKENFSFFRNHHGKFGVFFIISSMAFGKDADVVSIVVLSGNSEKKHFFYGKLHVGFRNQAHLPW